MNRRKLLSLVGMTPIAVAAQPYFKDYEPQYLLKFVLNAAGDGCDWPKPEELRELWDVPNTYGMPVLYQTCETTLFYGTKEEIWSKVENLLKSTFNWTNCNSVECGHIVYSIDPSKSKNSQLGELDSFNPILSTFDAKINSPWGEGWDKNKIILEKIKYVVELTLNTCEENVRNNKEISYFS